jgi:creatinine amidohydrolase
MTTMRGSIMIIEAGRKKSRPVGDHDPKKTPNRFLDLTCSNFGVIIWSVRTRFHRVVMIVKALQFLVFVLILAGAQPVFAQNSERIFLDDLTWPELKAGIASGKTTIIVPIGGTEQSGPHIALGKHNVRVRILSERIAKKLGNALVAPVVAYVPEGSIDPPAGHMRFPGTITISDEVFEKLLVSAAQSFKLHGFRNIVFLGDHGGYQSSLKTVADRLNRGWRAAHVPVRAHFIAEYYRSTQTEYVQALKSRGYREEEIGTHAGLADTALTLALEPGLVRQEQLRSGMPFGNGDGVTGQPQRASAELGKLGADAVVARTVDAINLSVAHPAR